VKFRVERDVLAEAVTWVARGLPVRPAVPVLAGVLVEAGADGTVTLSAFDYEVSARVTVAAEVTESRHGAGARAPACPTSRGPCRPTSRSTSPPTATRSRSPAGRRGSPCCRCRPPTTRPCRPSPPRAARSTGRPSPRRSPRSPSPPIGRHPADPHRGARRDRGREGHLPGHRPLPAGDARVHLEPQPPDASHVALIPAKTLAETARSLGQGGSVAVALGQAAGGDGLVGFEAGQRHSTSRLLDGEYPKVAKIFPTTVRDRGRRQDRRPGRSGQARGARRRAQHPGAAAVQ
jgi:DNA polymerase-3 subunit beta